MMIPISRKMPFCPRILSRIVWGCATLLLTFHGTTFAEGYSQIRIVAADAPTPIEQQVVSLLANRLSSLSGLDLQIIPQQSYAGPVADQLCILISTQDHHPSLARAAQTAGIKPLTVKDPGPEGFVLASIPSGEGLLVLVVAFDERGMLYAAGEILRQFELQENKAVFPENLHLRTAPAFEIRGTEVGQGHTMRKLTGARLWTEEEWQQAVLDYALAGANTFAIGHATPASAERYNFLKSYGLKTLTTLSPNMGTGPASWAAMEPIGRPGHLCPSIPEAYAAILAENEERWSKSVAYDYVRMYAGDGGGCICDLCAPYGKTYIHLCEALAEIILRYHPGTKIFATNQKLDNAGDQAIFDYLNEAPRTWLTALCYGPGSNAMSWQPGRRNDHRSDLFRYPGFGEYDRYLCEMVHQLPAAQSLVFFSDLTHWVYSQYGLVDYAPAPDVNRETPPYWSRHIYSRQPDPALYMVYDRRTFHARPRHFQQVFRETMRYGIGDVTYSEGHHDHCNQWIWQRLLWNPHASVENVVTEYARAFFGSEAAEPMAQAIFQLEENLTAPLAQNEGISQYVQLVRDARGRLPQNARQNSALWREYLQKGLLDEYCQLLLRQQLAVQQSVKKGLVETLENGNLKGGIEAAERMLQQSLETPEMAGIKEEARLLGEESDRLAGVRNEGFFNLNQDFIGLGWYKRQLLKTRQIKDESDIQRALQWITQYPDPGPGGFYDDAGDPSRSPHLIYGWPYFDGEVSSANLPAQRSMAFTADDTQGVTFAYEELDPAAQYRVRVTLVRPYYEPRYAATQIQKSESIYADDVCLVKDLILPEFESDTFEYDIPPECIRDGKLLVRFEKSADVGVGPSPNIELWRNCGGWGTLVSEIWLLRK